MIFGYKIYQKYINKDPILARGVRPIDADFYSGKDVIDREEEEFLANKAASGKANQGGKFYKRYIGWLL